MFKRIRFKRIIIYSYLLLIVINTVSILLVVDQYVLDRMTEEHTKYAIQTVHATTADSRNLFVKLVTPMCKNYLRQMAQNAALKLSDKMEELGLSGEERFADNPEIRRIVTQPIRYYDEDVGYLDLMSADYRAVIHPNPEIQGKDYMRWEKTFPKLTELLRRAVREGHASGFYDFLNMTGDKTRQKFMVIEKVPKMPYWVTASVYTQDFHGPILGEIKRHEKEHITQVTYQIESFSEKICRYFKYVCLAVLAVTSALWILISFRIAGFVTEPISELSEAAKAMAAGDFSVNVQKAGSVEIDELITVFNKLGGDLSRHIDVLKVETAAREAIESEIKVAHRIQMAIMQQDALHEPRPEMELHAAFDPAKDVAGDFYDFFYLDSDKNKLAFLVADVSGKALPAAIFMAQAKTVLKNVCLCNDAPDAALAQANKLCANSEFMFVTVFLAYYDIASGSITYANAGHHKTILVKADGSLEEFGLLGDAALGMFKDVEDYHSAERRLDVGDTLVLYTDGVTEAINPDKEEYGEERLFELIRARRKESTESISRAVIEETRAFEQGGRFDDITLLVFRRTA